MKVYIASDHAGFELKEKLIKFLGVESYDIEDMGPFNLDPQDDYPDYVLPLAEKVAETGAMGIILGGSGQGEAIAANKVEGVRVGVWYGGSLDLVKLMREHNNANIISLGARFITTQEAQEATSLFLETSFSGAERHERRIGKISEYEE